MRVCYVIPSLSVGGTERQLLQLLRGLAPDHELTVVCTRRDGTLAGDARRSGVPVHVLNARGGWDITQRWKLRRILRSCQPDILHTFLFGFDWWAALAARDAGVPVVISSRRELAGWMKRRHLFIQRRANRLVNCIVANSEAVARFAARQEKADPALFRVIPNGIRADDFSSHTDPHQIRVRYRIPFHTHVIGIVANFSPVKDYPLFVETAYVLLQRRADVHFLMVGSGPLVRDIERRIERRGMGACFTRTTSVVEIPDLYAVMDVCVLCSKTEGFPNAIIESMAAGTPVVAAAVGGVAELVRDGVTGRLAPTRRPEDFADAIEWVLDHPEEAKLLADGASQFVHSELTLETMVNRYRSLYAELIANARKKGR
jgi:glycosyltransferase involved in cell wall biosynthesis